MSVVGFIVDGMHVCTPYLDVARNIYKRARKAGFTRSQRKKLIGEALRRHKHNRAIVRDFRL